MDKNREERFKAFLAASKIDESTVDSFIVVEKDGYPYYPMSVFMIYLWNYVISKDKGN